MTKCLKVTTESGRAYLIHDGLWRRLPKEGESSLAGTGWQSVWALMHGTHFAHPWDSPDGTWESGAPVVGEFMHISCRDFWWTTTRVVKIETINPEASLEVS